VFTAEDFRVRYELVGRGATAEMLSSECFELRAGDRRVVLHVLPGRFAGRDVAWICRTNSTGAVVEGICYQGTPRDFHFKTLDDVTLITGLELLTEDQQSLPGPSIVENESSVLKAVWEIGERTLRVSR
jgi:hypothetical protein